MIAAQELLGQMQQELSGLQAAASQIQTQAQTGVAMCGVLVAATAFTTSTTLEDSASIDAAFGIAIVSIAIASLLSFAVAVPRKASVIEVRSFADFAEEPLIFDDLPPTALSGTFEHLVELRLDALVDFEGLVSRRTTLLRVSQGATLLAFFSVLTLIVIIETC